MCRQCRTRFSIMAKDLSPCYEYTPSNFGNDEIHDQVYCLCPSCGKRLVFANAPKALIEYLNSTKRVFTPENQIQVHAE